MVLGKGEDRHSPEHKTDNSTNGKLEEVSWVAARMKERFPGGTNWTFKGIWRESNTPDQSRGHLKRCEGCIEPIC